MCSRQIRDEPVPTPRLGVIVLPRDCVLVCVSTSVCTMVCGFVCIWPLPEHRSQRPGSLRTIIYEREREKKIERSMGNQ